MNYLISDQAVCRIAPATPGLFIITGKWVQKKRTQKWICSEMIQ